MFIETELSLYYSPRINFVPSYNGLSRQIILFTKYPLADLPNIIRPRRILSNPIHTLINHSSSKFRHMHTRMVPKLVIGNTPIEAIRGRLAPRSMNSLRLRDGDLNVGTVFPRKVQACVFYAALHCVSVSPWLLYLKTAGCEIERRGEDIHA